MAGLFLDGLHPRIATEELEAIEDGLELFLGLGAHRA